MNFEDIYQKLSAISDTQKALKMKAYMKNQFDFLGIPAPNRRLLQKPFFVKEKNEKINWDFVEECWQCEFRELQYVACDYLKTKEKQLWISDLPKIKNLIVQKSWWDSVDALAPIVGKIVLKFPSIEITMEEWSVDENLWLRRSAIIHQLLRKEKTNTLLLEQIIKNNLGSKEFFINKAIGWVLRDYAKTNPVWVRKFVDENRSEMSNLSIREALKYL